MSLPRPGDGEQIVGFSAQTAAITGPYAAPGSPVYLISRSEPAATGNSNRMHDAVAVFEQIVSVRVTHAPGLLLLPLMRLPLLLLPLLL